MGKIAKKKTTVTRRAPLKRSVRKNPVSLSYSKTIIITMGVLFLTLFLFVYEAQQIQEQRSSAQTTNCDIAASETQMTVEENNLLQLINQYRASKGAPPLTASTGLGQSAAWMSNDMKTKNLMSHTDSLGRGLEARISQCGYNAAGTAVGENVAKGTGGGAQQIFDLWKTSTEGHNEEMLKTSHKVVGIAQSGEFWTADFGGAADGAAAAAPSGTTSGAPSDITGLTPSFNTLAPCPNCTTTQTTPPVSAAAPAPTSVPVETISGMPLPSAAAIAPCEGDNAIAEDNHKKKKEKKSKGESDNEGLFEKIFAFLLELIKKLIELLGGGAPAVSPGEPTPGQPCDPLVLPSGGVPALDPGSASPANTSIY